MTKRQFFRKIRVIFRFFLNLLTLADALFCNSVFLLLLFFTFSAARYQNELAGVDAEQLAERFYHQALSVMPHIGE